MPTKNTQKENILDKRYDFDVTKLMDSSESYKSLLYGIVTVVVLFIVIVLGVRAISQNRAQIDDGAVSTQKVEENTSVNKYVVVEGDTLWSISEKFYNDGFKWGEIARANNIAIPTSLSAGSTITIPKLATSESTMSAQKTTNSIITNDQKITADSYTVIHGDNLWTIAVRAYGDGYRWTDIAKVNKLENPDLIFSGNYLILPRP